MIDSNFNIEILVICALLGALSTNGLLKILVCRIWYVEDTTIC